jgi:hypothetical protein
MSLDQELDIKEHPFAAATLFLSNKQCVPPAQLQMFLEPLHSDHLNCYFCNPKLSQNIYGFLLHPCNNHTECTHPEIEESELEEIDCTDPETEKSERAKKLLGCRIQS